MWLPSFRFPSTLNLIIKKQNKQVFHTQSRLTGRFTSLILRKKYFKDFLQHKNINDHNTTGLKSAPPQQATTLKWCLHDNKVITIQNMFELTKLQNGRPQSASAVTHLDIFKETSGPSSRVPNHAAYLTLTKMFLCLNLTENRRFYQNKRKFAI